MFSKSTVVSGHTSSQKLKVHFNDFLDPQEAVLRARKCGFIGQLSFDYKFTFHGKSATKETFIWKTFALGSDGTIYEIRCSDEFQESGPVCREAMAQG